jgi:hypothetical protein
MWVLTIKYKEDGSVDKYKARLVVLGNQQNFGSAAAGDVAAPVTRFTTARMLLSVANFQRWEIHQMDAVTAFLNADMGEEIFVSMDEETADILRKTSYSLTDKSLHLSDSRYKLAVKALYGFLDIS